MKRTLAALAFGLVFSAQAEQIVVSNYGVTTNGMPFAVAMAKGYFKEFRVNVDGILSSDGGGTTMRNLLGGKLSYGESTRSAVVIRDPGGRGLRSSATTCRPSPNSSGWRSRIRRSRPPRT